MYHIDAAYINDYGLLNARKEEIVSENAPLNSVQYLRLFKRRYGHYNNRVLSKLGVYIKSCETSLVGLYNQFPVRYMNKDDYMSPDQLIAFVAYFKMVGKEEKIKEVWRYLKSHMFTYDNVRPGQVDERRLMQPSAVFFTAVASGKWWYRPALVSVAMFSCMSNKGETSGKLKAWTMLDTLNMRWSLKACEKILAGFKCFKDVFLENHKEDRDPVRLEAIAVLEDCDA